MSAQLIDQKTWGERYDATLMNTFGHPKRVLVRGRGADVWDADGNHYTDLLAGLAVHALGHAHPAVIEAISEQAGTLGHISNFFASPPQIMLGERLVALATLDAPGTAAGGSSSGSTLGLRQWHPPWRPSCRRRSGR